MSSDIFKRPTTDGNHGSVTTTPSAASMIRLLGGQRHAGVTLSNDEMRAVNRLYGYKKEQPNVRPPPPVAPVRSDFQSAWEYDAAVRKHKTAMEAHANWEDPMQFMQAGADRNAFKHAEADGLRLVGWLAKHLQPNEDPLRVLVQLAMDAGWDVDHEDVAWASKDEEADNDEAPESAQEVA
jgi:hypothetical protein